MRIETTWLLMSAGFLSREKFYANLAAAKAADVKPIEALSLTNLCDPGTAAAAASRIGCLQWWASWPPTAIRAEVRRRIPGHMAAEHRSIPLRVDAGGQLWIAMVDPLDEMACEELEFFAGAPLIRVAVPAPMASDAVSAMYEIDTSFRKLWRESDRVPRAARAVLA